MKKKYLVIVISVLVIAVIVLFGQLFTVRTISVVFSNKTGLADEAQIIAASGITYKKNIFNVKEAEVKKNINAAFDDNSIVVTNVERVFYDEVVIYVKERVPIFKIEFFDESGFVATDIDFQRGKKKQESELENIKLIPIVNYKVKDTFDTKECIALRSIAKALVQEGMSEEALPYFIDKIFVLSATNEIAIRLRGSEALLTVDISAAGAETTKLYKEYLSLDISERNNVKLSVKK